MCSCIISEIDSKLLSKFSLNILFNIYYLICFEIIINSFAKYGSVPIINLESSCAHPLQALADAITIEEHKNKSNPKIVISWAPHPKSLPHAVANSFINMAKMSNYDLVITNPIGYDLNPKITKGINVTHNQEEAFKNADFIYAKNWSSYNDYGKVLINDNKWMINKRKMEITNNAKFMHCLPVRRNVVVEDAVLDSNYSIRKSDTIYISVLLPFYLDENQNIGSLKKVYQKSKLAISFLEGVFLSIDSLSNLE